MDENKTQNIEITKVEAVSPIRKHFFTVTPLSKILALALFVALPFLGFWVGLNFQSDLKETNKLTNIQLTDTPNNVEELKQDFLLVSEDFVKFEMTSLHGLYGGYNVLIGADGIAQVEYKEPGGEPEFYNGKISTSEMDKMVNYFASEHFNELKVIQGKGIPDESIITIAVTKPSGEYKEVSQPYNSMSDEFKLIFNNFIIIGETAREMNAKASNIDDETLYRQLLGATRIGPRGNTIVYRTHSPVEGTQVDADSRIVIVDADTKNIRSHVLFSDLIDIEKFGLPVFLFLSEDGNRLFFTEGFYEGYNEDSPLYSVTTFGGGELTLFKDIHINLHEPYKRNVILPDKVIFVDSTQSAFEKCYGYGEPRRNKNIIKMMDLDNLSVATVIEGGPTTDFRISDESFFYDLEYTEREVFIINRSEIKNKVASRDVSNESIIDITADQSDICWSGYTSDSGYSMSETAGLQKTFTVYIKDNDRNLLIPQF